MAVNDLIKLRKGTSVDWNSANPVLASGEPGYDLSNKILKIGDGTSNWNNLTSINLSSLNITDFNSSVSGIVPVKNIVAGSNITISSSSGIYTINSIASGTSGGSTISSTNYSKLDNISSSFNGSSTSFPLSVSGTSYYPTSANTLGIYVGGVAQEPISSYSVSGSNIIFTEAPASGLTFWGVGYGTTAVATLNGIAPGSSGSPAISSSNDLTTGFYFPSSGNIGIAGNLGIGTSSPSTNLDINSNKFRVRNSKTPASTSDTGNTGDICWDSNYIYVCTNTNNWTRTPISSWSSDPYFSSVSLLLHMDDTGSSFIDYSSSPKIITTIGDTTQSTMQSKFGGKSGYFDSSGDRLSIIPSTDFAFGTGDFTVEAWLRENTRLTYPSVLEIGDHLSSSGIIFLTSSNGGNNSACIYSGAFYGSATVPATGEWYHIAWVRKNLALTIYVNGSAVSTVSFTNNLTNSSSITVGSKYAGSSPGGPYYDFGGYIDELRVTKGIARYNGASISVPTAPFPNYNT